MAAPKSEPGLKGDVSSIFDLLKGYAKQETIDPLKGVGRYLGFGLAGSLLMGIGLVLVALAGLRALQTETGTTFTGNWSWAPYFITVAGTAIVIALAASRIGKGGARKEGSR
jgi:hypothetical protein